MVIEDVDINKSIEEYSQHKSGEILKAPDTGEEFEVFSRHRYYTTRITSWVGICGVHYYAMIVIHFFSMGRVGAERGGLYGYLGGLDIDDELKIECTTLITEEHRKYDPERWRPRDTRTMAFLTEEGAREAIDNVVKKHLDSWECADPIYDDVDEEDDEEID